MQAEGKFLISFRRGDVSNDNKNVLMSCDDECELKHAIRRLYPVAEEIFSVTIIPHSRDFSEVGRWEVRDTENNLLHFGLYFIIPVLTIGRNIYDLTQIARSQITDLIRMA